MSGRVVELGNVPAAGGEDLVDRVQALAVRLESIGDDAARETAHELLGALLELYGTGLERVMEALAAAGPEADGVRTALVDDPVVGSLLLIHGLHPVDLETRVLEALDEVRPYMASHGGDVELVGLEDGVARLRLVGSCNGCPSSTSTLELAVKEALEANAPDLAGIEVEGVVEPPRPPPSMGGGRLPVVGAAPATRGGWTLLSGVAELPSGAVAARPVDGVRVLVANVGGSLLAYRNGCAGCGAPLDAGRLEGGVLACPACDRRFELPLAGRSVDGAGLQLVPVPLLVEDGAVRVAVGG